MKYTIRPAKLSDIGYLINLLEILFKIEDDFKFNPEHHKYALTQIINHADCCCMVATNEDALVIGMCCAQWAYSTASGKKSAWLEDFILLPEYRRKKIGTHLLNKTIEWCDEQGCNRIQLAYDIKNSHAIKFYQQQKFTSTQLGIFTQNL